MYRLGAVLEVVPKEKLKDAAFELARKIAAKSPRALRLAKWSLNGIELLDPKQSYRFEQGFTLELYTSPDSQEARDAFVQKRDAKFDGGKR
jgi:enoyl-CoA hydratase